MVSRLGDRPPLRARQKIEAVAAIRRDYALRTLYGRLEEEGSYSGTEDDLAAEIVEHLRRAGMPYTDISAMPWRGIRIFEETTDFSERVEAMTDEDDAYEENPEARPPAVTTATPTPPDDGVQVPVHPQYEQMRPFQGHLVELVVRGYHRPLAGILDVSAPRSAVLTTLEMIQYGFACDDVERLVPMQLDPHELLALFAVLVDAAATIDAKHRLDYVMRKDADAGVKRSRAGAKKRLEGALNKLAKGRGRPWT